MQAQTRFALAYCVLPLLLRCCSSFAALAFSSCLRSSLRNFPASSCGKSRESSWLGIEFVHAHDDAVMGRHDGMYQGVRYWNASRPRSGRFVRASSIRPVITSRRSSKDHEQPPFGDPTRKSSASRASEPLVRRNSQDHPDHLDDIRLRVDSASISNDLQRLAAASAGSPPAAPTASVSARLVGYVPLKARLDSSRPSGVMAESRRWSEGAYGKNRPSSEAGDEVAVDEAVADEATEEGSEDGAGQEASASTAKRRLISAVTRVKTANVVVHTRRERNSVWGYEGGCMHTPYLLLVSRLP